jgi:hypothetical protein
MKKLALIALIALGAAAPALAQTAKNATPKPVAEVSEPAPIEINDGTPLDVIIQEGLEQDRAKLMMRCAGPPPKFAKEKLVASAKPASEPAVEGGNSSGG